MSTNKWLSKDIDVEKRNGLCLAFTEDEEKLLNERSKIRKEYGADIEIISKKEALRIDPNINKNINSLFIWKNKMFDENEVELSFKTNDKNVKKLIFFKNTLVGIF